MTLGGEATLLTDLGMAAEADLLARAVPAGAVLVTLDERGKVMSSPEFAAMLARWRDGGRQVQPQLDGQRLHGFGRGVRPHQHLGSIAGKDFKHQKDHH